MHFSPAGRRYNAIMVASAIAPWVRGPLARGARAATAEGAASTHWDHWVVALVAQAVFLGALALAATAVLAWRRRRAPEKRQAVELVTLRDAWESDEDDEAAEDESPRSEGSDDLRLSIPSDSLDILGVHDRLRELQEIHGVGLLV